MASFKALNIESDDESDVEIDDTKEIQIEEALKLYQTALKFDSDGPEAYDKAAEAYRQLFESEIFKYPESQAELQRIELYGPIDFDETWDDTLALPAAVSANLETGPGTLPQLLHLSHKNYAHFKLKALSAKFESFNVTLNQILVDATDALQHFVQALDKDDSDLDLWRRTAAVGEILDSKRIARFCLESVLDDDEVSLNNLLSLPGLDEGLAGEQLRSLVNQLQDHLSLLQGPLSTGKRRILSKFLKQQLDPYEDITEKESLLRAEREESVSPPLEVKRVLLKAPNTWADFGDTLLRQLMSEEHGTPGMSPGVAIGFEVTDAPPPTLNAIEPSPSPESLESASLTIETKFPSSMAEQFPGLDRGRPTVQPQIASADPGMKIDSVSPTEPDADMADSPTMTLPSRKRSGDAAGLHGGPDEGRTKSKRLRARDSNVESGDARQAEIDANTRWEYEQQLNEFQAADDWMFETVGNLFEKIGVVGFDAARHVREEMAASSDSTPADSDEPMAGLKPAKVDIQRFLDKFDEHSASPLLHGGENIDIGHGQGFSGTGNMFTGSGSRESAKAPLMPDDGLRDLLIQVNEDWSMTKEIAWKFIETLLRAGKLTRESNSYTQYLWPEQLKTMVVRVLVNFDECIFETASEELERWRQNLNDDKSSALGLVDLAQAVFELHLDIYSLIKQPNSGVEADIILSQGDRLQRWSDLAREFIHCRSTVQGSQDLKDQLNIRFLWATTFHLNVCSDVDQDHVLECMKDLKDTLTTAGELVIRLQNNAIMPEVSAAALDRELSIITTKDFFLRVTSQDASDPAATIENLEPLLESLYKADAESSDESERMDVEVAPPNVAPELVSFLETSSISVRLMLWQRLRDAYNNIDYKPMTVYCYFRMIRMVIAEIKSSDTAALPPPERQKVVLKSVRLLQDMLKKLYEVLQSCKDALECIDGEGLKLAASSLGDILQLTQVFNVAEDSIRVGQSQPPTLSNGLPVQSFKAVTKLVHEMQAQVWTIMYALFKETISQNADLYPTPLEDRFDFLRTVHRNLGIRNICGVLNRAFVRMLKDEFFQMANVDGFDSEQAQVLYDLYRLNCFLNPSYELIEHNCTSDAFMDRGVAMQAADMLMAQATKLPVKDLVKHSLRETIDKVHGSLPRKRPTEAILHNREIYRAFLRSPINPIDLYGCLNGERNQLSVTPIPRDDALLASKGWYFLMGHIALTKFRSQKRNGQTPTEDVDIAVAFFMQDLEYTGENWETWFRLAQAYDTKIEESIVWSAEKLNNNMADLVSLQRHAIHCYTMATALAFRSADLTFETSGKMTELFYEFANRLYSSAREPFGMQAFALDDLDRFVSISTGVQKDKPFQPLRVYTAIKLANVLYNKALRGKPDSWMTHYMIGKCLWKMHAAPSRLRPTGDAPTAERVVQALVRSLELLPDKDRKPDGKKEAVLEPHYKLVSVVHKLLTVTKTIDLQQAKEALEHTPFAQKQDFPESMEDWVPYVLAVLKSLRSADKSNWYHRMIVRSALIIYEDSESGEDADVPGQNLGALAAKHELTQQMFTKTMVLNVWKPDSERPGRHFVYTARYTRFFARLLEQLKDRSALDQLARRVRRRPHDIFEHSTVWADLCTIYLRMLRNYAAIPEGLETSSFSNIAHEEFLLRKDPLEEWMQAQDAGVSPALDVLREVHELKKLNQGLMKAGAIDDLIGDAYAQLFTTIGKQLWEEARRLKQEEEVKREAEKPPAPASPPRNPMMSLTHLMNVDGTTEAPANPAAQPSTAAVHGANAAGTTEAAPARRKIGVGRREIRNCAEACFQKAKVPDIDKAIANAPRVQVLIERERPGFSGEASVETSAPGSVHDSADDESELSELEEIDEDVDGEEKDDDKRPVFPNLAPVESREDDEGSDTAGEGTANEAEDVEMQDGADAKSEAEAGGEDA